MQLLTKYRHLFLTGIIVTFILFLFPPWTSQNNFYIGHGFFLIAQQAQVDIGRLIVETGMIALVLGFVIFTSEFFDVNWTALLKELYLKNSDNLDR